MFDYISYHAQRKYCETAKLQTGRKGHSRKTETAEYSVRGTVLDILPDHAANQWPSSSGRKVENPKLRRRTAKHLGLVLENKL